MFQFGAGGYRLLVPPPGTRLSRLMSTACGAPHREFVPARVARDSALESKEKRCFRVVSYNILANSYAYEPYVCHVSKRLGSIPAWRRTHALGTVVFCHPPMMLSWNYRLTVSEDLLYTTGN